MANVCYLYRETITVFYYLYNVQSIGIGTH